MYLEIFPVKPRIAATRVHYKRLNKRQACDGSAKKKPASFIGLPYQGQRFYRICQFALPRILFIVA
jgi:hypothetical protein